MWEEENIINTFIYTLVFDFILRIFKIKVTYKIQVILYLD